jgi:hypothetical protein
MDGEKKEKVDRNLRCLCCRENGHTVVNCPRDPNMRTVPAIAQIDQEFQRILKIKDFRKLYADTAVQTTHMLKKSVMIPLKHDEDGKAIEAANISHPFMRGIMEFDDYNYNQYNEMILVPELKPTSPKERQQMQQQ